MVFYNGTKEQPERQVLYLHESFPEGVSTEDASLDCRAVMLNINIEHNKKIMQKCRKLEEYAIFIGKIREYTNLNYTIEKAIELAVDECIKEGILETILCENREEVCSMLLTEYDEQAHIESEREIAKVEGQERVNQLVRLLIENNRTDDLLKSTTNKQFQQQLFEEFGI